MKKVLAAILVVAVAAAGVYFFLFYSDRNYPEKIFPGDTIAYLLFSGADSVRKDARQTLLWQKIESSPRKSLYQHQLDQVMSLTESVVGIDPRPLFSAFTREVAIGIIPVPGNLQAGALVGYIRKESKTQEFIETKVDPGMKRRMQDLQKKLSRHRDFTYYKYSSGSFPANTSPCYAFLDHHLIIVSSEAGMKLLLDTSRKQVPSLRKTDLFRDAKKQVHFRNGVFFYLNGESLLKFAGQRLPSRVQFLWPAMMQLTGFQAVRGFAYRIGFQNDGFSEEGFVKVDAKRQGLTKSYMEQKPQKLAGLAFVPLESQGAGASTLPDGLAVWKEIETQIKGALAGKELSQYGAMLQMLAGLLNFDFQKDLFEPVGRQLSYGYTLPASETDIKNTRYFVALELRNPAHFRSVLQRLGVAGEAHGVERLQENYQGKQLDLLGLRAGSVDVRAGYLVEGSWFYFGTSQEFLKRALDAMKNKKGIDSLPDFKKVTAGFPEELNSISYTNIQTTFNTYASMMQNLSQQSETRWIQDYGLAEEMRDLSKSLFGSGSCTLIEKDGIRYTSYSSVPNALLYLPAILVNRQ